MSIKERKEREKNEMRKLISDAASKLIATEGVEKLSIRKIADRIEYSPAIIYHYFKNKDEIINHLMKKGYQKILDALLSTQEVYENPAIKLQKLLHTYITTALQMPEEYKTILLNDSPGVLEHTSTLFKGASAKRQALGILFNCVKDILCNESDITAELYAQIIWTATFGLIIRLIIENVPEKQRENLIDHHIKFILDSLI